MAKKGFGIPLELLREPIMKNPNSFENITCILDSLKESTINESDSGEGRKWVFVGADGPPYCLMRRIQRNNPGKYDWCAMLSGKGHLKMNMLKSIFKFGNKIVFYFLGQDVLKYDTFKSYNYFIQCKDNHKSYQALKIFLFGTTMELIRMYGAEIPNPTPYGFLEWACNATNPTLRFICQFLFNFVLAVYVHRVGDRYNDAKCSDAGRMKFFDFFFALNHPIYREVEYNDLRERALYVPEVTSLRMRNNTYANEDGELISNHQDGDFKLEERVKMMKRLSPKGKMDRKMWQWVARGMDNVDKAIKHSKGLLHMENEEATQITPIENEIDKWCAILRESGYLFTHNEEQVYGMNGKPLNPALRNLISVVERKRNLYFEMAKNTNLENIRCHW